MRTFFLTIFCLSTFIAGIQKPQPQLFIIGDSTVKNSTGKGDGGLWGWGTLIPELFDTTRIKIQNHAIGGRSSRTFITEGRWDKVLAQLKAGDYVLMQFGHNDGGAINDTTRARGSIRGIGEETQEIDNLLTKKHEIVHSYGWYMRKYIDDTKAKGAIPIVCSPVPRNIFKEGKIERPRGSYNDWAATVAQTNGAFFVDLYEIIARQYEALGEQKVKTDFFTEKDHTHTTKAGAALNAASVVEGIKLLKTCTLAEYAKNK